MHVHECRHGWPPVVGRPICRRPGRHALPGGCAPSSVERPMTTRRVRPTLTIDERHRSRPEPDLSPILVGRDEVLALADARLAEAAAGRGSTLLIAGEAGVGKTRLREGDRSAGQCPGLCRLQGRARAAGPRQPGGRCSWACIRTMRLDYPENEASAQGLLDRFAQAEPRAAGPTAGPGGRPRRPGARIASTGRRLLVFEDLPVGRRPQPRGDRRSWPGVPSAYPSLIVGVYRLDETPPRDPAARLACAPADPATRRRRCGSSGSDARADAAR